MGCDGLKSRLGQELIQALQADPGGRGHLDPDRAAILGPVDQVEPTVWLDPDAHVAGAPGQTKK